MMNKNQKEILKKRENLDYEKKNYVFNELIRREINNNNNPHKYTWTVVNPEISDNLVN